MTSSSCVELDCREQALFSCSCSKSSFVCKFHIAEHLITPGSHVPISFVTLVPENQKVKVLNYLTTKKQLLRQNLNELIKFSNKLLKLIIEQTKQVQNLLIIEQNHINSMIKAFYKTSILHKDAYKTAISYEQNSEQSLKFDLNRASAFICKIFNFESFKTQFKDDNFAIIFRTSICNQIDLVDLETFKKKNY